MLVPDLPDSVFDVPICAIDTETDTRIDGLDFRVSRSVLLQYHSIAGTYSVRLPEELPPNVKKLLTDKNITKVLHYALFDMCMLYNNHGVLVTPVACTKVMAKVIEPNHLTSQSLKYLLKQWNGIEISKRADIRMGDWTQELTTEQIEYAEDDVRYLLDLHGKLSAEIDRLGVRDVYTRAIEAIYVKTEFSNVENYLSY